MSSGAYQSKVFNALSRQSRRLQQQTEQAWRWSKVATVWSVQIALYPIYVAFQSMRLVGKQLQQTSQRTRLKLRAAQQAIQRATQPTPPVTLSPDTPIWHTLQAIESLPLSGEPLPELLVGPATDGAIRGSTSAWAAQNVGLQPNHFSQITQERAAVAMSSSAAVASGVRIQGVASLLTTRGLVLVTDGNGILDVLTPEQQTILARRIVGELAIYWRERRLAGDFPSRRLTSPLVSRFLPLPHDRQNALPPIRSLWQTMGWMQRGAIAISVNLFQEAKLVWHRSTSPALASSPALKSAQPAWVDMEAQFYEALRQASQQTGIWLLQTLRGGTRRLTPLTPASNSAVPPRLPAAERLPRATPGWIEQLDRWLSRLPGLRVEPPAASPEPWLTMEELFGPVEIVSSEEDASASFAAHPAAGELALELSTVGVSPTASWEVVDTAALETLTKIQAKHTLDSVAQSLPHPVSSRSSAQSPHQSRSVAIGGLEPRERMPRPLQRSATASPEATDATQLPTTCIETKAELVGYVKHPLEQVLEWLDRGMLWIEERVAQLWRWLRQQFG